MIKTSDNNYYVPISHVQYYLYQLLIYSPLNGFEPNQSQNKIRTCVISMRGRWQTNPGAHHGYINHIAYLICKCATSQVRCILVSNIQLCTTRDAPGGKMQLSFYQPGSIWITICQLIYTTSYQNYTGWQFLNHNKWTINHPVKERGPILQT